ncbi:cytochrome C oxidase subunit IV family protein [Parafilimonas sp.]|uniref:cytochrome C oxidase subunit IV family protein n=1 Tax=Parafilimonas sp. TaxID=1969739 RepID=UPI0039E2E9F8
MDHTLESLEHERHAGGGTKEIWKVTLYLSVLTVIELMLGFSMIGMDEASLKRHLIKGVIVVLMIWKAFYIVGYFMHLKHELRNMIMTIVVPLFLFVWFIIAFLTDGNSFKNDKNKWDSDHLERSKEKMPVQEEGTHHLE